MRAAAMAAQEVTSEVHIDDSTPPCFVGLEEVQHRAHDAGVVHENVDASVFGHQGVEHRGDLVAV